MEQPGKFDVVYAWGVLQYTGDMWHAMEHTATKVAPDGKLIVASYNGQGARSRYWYSVKWAYNRFSVLRHFLIIIYSPCFVGLCYVSRLITGKKLERGMSLWFDMIDWSGAIPFETAKPEEIFFFFFRERGFELTDVKTCAGKWGCNEFVFAKHGNSRNLVT